ncbi:MAG: cobalamin-dependent protein [Coriobacteriales bacterium]|nr:cobalamin-dependent protein [Coriobacteriales bacterium]
MSINEKIVKSLTDLDEAVLYDEVKAAIAAGSERMDIIASLQQGMANIGTMFSNREYFISELMLAAEIFVECQNLLGGEAESDARYGTFVIGTVYGDVHDIGKNIVASIFSSSGFKVIDLGVDVQPQAFLDAIIKYDPKVIGLSCLLTTAFPGMKDVVDQIKAAGLDQGRQILIGGGPVEQSTVEYVGADGYSFSVQEAVEMAIAFVTA